jgi:hypothetical protein
MALSDSIPFYVTRKAADGTTGQLDASLWALLGLVALIWLNGLLWGIIGVIEAVGWLL